MDREECILNKGNPCKDCGECLICDLNPEKECDNCMECIEGDADYRAIKVDEIQYD